MADSIIGKISVGDGATFTPDVTDGVLSFTNNKNLPNPEPYNIAAKVLDEGDNELRTLVTAAETAAGNAATSETNAHNSEQAAKASETAAATSASAAKTSETNAASSETAAATSATNAATSETNASNSASAAATSESNASDSATAAAASAAEVEAALDDYLPLSGGTLTGVVNGVTPTAGDNSTKIATTEFVAKSLAEARVLPGTVTAFSGTFKDGYPVNKNTGLVDKEWHLCDGTNGTPDLRNRFIYGGDGTNNGATGGEASVTLTVQTIPAHSHTGTTSANGGHSHTVKTFKEFHKINGNNYDGYCTGSTDRTTSTAGNHQHSLNIDSTGGGQPHNNMPPYYVLAYIMKL